MTADPILHISAPTVPHEVSDPAVGDDVLDWVQCEREQFSFEVANSQGEFQCATN